MKMKTCIQDIIISFLIIMCLTLFISCVHSSTETAVSSSTLSTKNIKTTSVPSMTLIPQNYFYKAPLSIDKTYDGQTERVNLVKFTGIIPSSGATILINNNAVNVDNDGNYYIYLDLKKGQNTIEVKTVTGSETKTENINIYFAPPLAVRLNS